MKRFYLVCLSLSLFSVPAVSLAQPHSERNALFADQAIVAQPLASAEPSEQVALPASPEVPVADSISTTAEDSLNTSNVTFSLLSIEEKTGNCPAIAVEDGYMSADTLDLDFGGAN